MEVALDHWLTWQLRHMTADPGPVAELAAAYERGEPFGDRALPEIRVGDNVRAVEPTVRSRLLNRRYLEPRQDVGLLGSDGAEAGEADVLLFNGQADVAAKAYREQIAITAAPVPDAWIGLALAISRLEPTPTRRAFTARLPLIFDVHTCLATRGVTSDPLALAGWFS